MHRLLAQRHLTRLVARSRALKSTQAAAAQRVVPNGHVNGSAQLEATEAERWRRSTLLRKRAEADGSETNSLIPATEVSYVGLKLQDAKGSVRELQARVGSTLLDVAHDNGINVDGTCDGKLECSTCHCVMGSNDLYQQSEDLALRSTLPGEVASVSLLAEKRVLESDLLDSAFAVEEKSRLSCQVRVTEAMEGMEIRFPNIIEKSQHDQSFAVEEIPAFDFSAPEPAATDEIVTKKFKNFTKSAIPALFEKYAANAPAETAKFLNDNLDLYTTLANILPFRTNNYVLEELIDWNNVPEDPVFQLTFPQPDMLFAHNIDDIVAAKKRGASSKEIRALANKIRAEMNPHPAKQQEMNVPSKAVSQGDTGADLSWEDAKAEAQAQAAADAESEIEFERGMQHKYRETVLFFPSESQYCHSYCTYCFRWAQFVGSSDLQFASNDLVELMNYLRRNKSVTDLLITGGDPMVLNSEQLARYLYPIVNDPELDHVQDIRIGSKSLAYWPYKYVTDDDADDLLRVFENVCKSGKKHISFMAHFTHPAELQTPVVREAIRRIRATGVNIRTQAPLVNHINNDPQLWADMWKEQLKLGLIPYYMFVERDTGAKEWFGLPLERCLEVYTKALQKVPGLARTVRGPSMSCTPGKVAVVGLETVPSHAGSPNAVKTAAGTGYEEKVFILKFLQSRNPAWIDKTFFAKYDPKAKWLDDLEPAFGEEHFFFESEHDAMELQAADGAGSSGQMFA